MKPIYLLVIAVLQFAALPLWAQSADNLTGDSPPPNGIWLDSLGVSRASQDYGAPHAGKTVDGRPLTLRSKVYVHGLGTHALSRFNIDLKGAVTGFVSTVGVDDERKDGGSVEFQVWADGKMLAGTKVLRGGDAPQSLSVDLTGAKKLTLLVTDGDDGYENDHADWAGAALILNPGATEKPEALAADAIPAPEYGIPNEAPRLVVPPYNPLPAIHGPLVTGATPGRPFLFLIPATGATPLRYAAFGLPAGLRLDAASGIITGSCLTAGATKVKLRVTNSQGTATRPLTIVAGDHCLARTPPMGWNSWNCWAGAVDDAKIRTTLDSMVKSGLAAHGFQYINIDDTWQGDRDATGEIRANAKFPDMKSLCDTVHATGLKIGIYSSPGPKTCGNFEGSYLHENLDAATWAAWGVDYVKHDWCSYGNVAVGEGLERAKLPYRKMRDALDRCGRDIVYSLCQYGMDEVWKWGAAPDIEADCWRTTGDISDNWRSMASIVEQQKGHEAFAAPGHWNDPDMLIVGQVGWGNPHPTHLKPNEQITHISMWCMLAAPLLIGCDTSRLDPFTTALLTNDEVLDIDQDAAGKAASRVSKSGGIEIWTRPLSDGAWAAALLNTGPSTATGLIDWKSLGWPGNLPVRDLWLHKNCGTFAENYSVAVPAHGTVLLKIGVPR